MRQYPFLSRFITLTRLCARRGTSRGPRNDFTLATSRGFTVRGLRGMRGMHTTLWYRHFTPFSYETLHFSYGILVLLQLLLDSHRVMTYYCHYKPYSNSKFVDKRVRKARFFRKARVVLGSWVGRARYIKSQYCSLYCFT